MKTLKSVLFAAALSTTGAASAGIPVADGLHLAQTIAVSMAEQMMHEALAQASDQLSEKLAQEGFDLDRELQKQAEDFAWEMYEETTQKYGYGWNYEIGSAEFYKHMETYTNEAARNKDAATMEESLAKYKSKVNDDYRKANGMQSEQAHIQKVMDKDLNWKVMVDSTLAEVNERHKTIEELRAKADAAKTAQEKTDLQIAIGIEQNAINNEMMRMQLASEAQALENKTELHRINSDVMKIFNEVDFKMN
jgi:hypothetical protein